MNAAKICPMCGKPAVPDAPQGLCPECLMKSGFETRGANEPGGGQSNFVPPPVEQIAKLFPQLEILELLGQGGMGAVYKARQPALDRFVALKILPPKSASDPGFAERFNREARALARLNHPNIVAVYDFGQAGDMPYFLMEYVEGSTLRQIERSGRLSPGNTLAIVVQICEALQFAHDEGVVHRDIKPENILLDQKGRVKIADFGIAKVLDQPPEDISLTGARDVVGTAPYMAPEQLENPQNVDHRADIFSLGVVFYELLTGELPLGKFQVPSQKVQIDVRLDEVVLHTLAKEPARRYQQASEVKTDVETIAFTPSEAAPPVLGSPPPAQAAAPSARRMSTGWKVAIVLGALGVAGLVLVLGVLGLFFVRVRKATQAVSLVTSNAVWTGQVVIEHPVRGSRTSLISSNAAWALLNNDQRLFVQCNEREYQHYLETRPLDDWPPQERANLEQRSIALLRGAYTSDFYRAINTLAALRSTNALPLLRPLAFEHGGKLLRSEASNRRRCMATRALGMIGDPSVVPEMIPLLYHNYRYVRWWAQVSLVRLTGQNFGSDWEAWGNWWNSQHRQPPFDSKVIRWWPGQPQPLELAQHLGGLDGKFIEAMKAKIPLGDSPAGAEGTDDKKPQEQ